MKLKAHTVVLPALPTSSEFESIVREQQDRVFRTLVRLTGSREHVEDLAQEVFLRLYRGLEHFRGDAQLTTYLYRIIVNVAQDEWKCRRREREAIAAPVAEDGEEDQWIENFPSLVPDAEATLAEKQLWQAVDEELLQLSENERSILVLYHQEECSYEQIAHLLKMPIGTVRTHLHRGRDKLGKLVRARMAGTAAKGAAH
jgi:RNA polymerase sigma-70 factor (ECF subfamily)